MTNFNYFKYNKCGNCRSSRLVKEVVHSKRVILMSCKECNHLTYGKIPEDQYENVLKALCNYNFKVR